MLGNRGFDTLSQSCVDRGLVITAVIDSGLMERGFEIHAAIDHHRRNLHDGGHDLSPTRSAQCEPGLVIGGDDHRAHI